MPRLPFHRTWSHAGRLIVVVLGTLAALAVSAPAMAAPAPFVSLRYEVESGAVECPTVDEFRGKVVRRLGYDPFLDDASLRVEARIWRDDRGHHGSLDWGEDSETRLGHRRFTSPLPSCRELIPAMVFALAVQIQMMAIATGEGAEKPSDATVGESPKPETPTAAPPADAVPKVSDKTLVDPVASPSDRRPWMGGGGVGASVGVRRAPETTGLGRVFLALHNGRALFEVGGEASLQTTGYLDARAGFRHRVVLGTAAGCMEGGALSICGLAKVGAVMVRGVAVDRSLSPTGFVSYIGARLGWMRPLGDHLGVQARIEGEFLLTPWTVELNTVAAWSVPRVGASAGVDLFLRFE